MERDLTSTHFKTYRSPLAGFTSPNFQPPAPTDQQLPTIYWISSAAGHSQDVNRKLCQYEFPSGVCKDQTCTDVHARDLSASDDDVRRTVAPMFPNAGPRGLASISAALNMILTIPGIVFLPPSLPFSSYHPYSSTSFAVTRLLNPLRELQVTGKGYLLTPGELDPLFVDAPPCYALFNVRFVLSLSFSPAPPPTFTPPTDMRRDVRVLLVGDEGVGKSTIVTSLIKEEYVDNVQHVVPEVTIPPEVTPENVTTYIVDSSAGPADRPHLDSEIRKAHVICVVYAIDNPNSFDRVGAYWLPYFRSLGVNVPVILVGNKIDLRGGEVSNEDLENEVAPIMEEFKEVETCVECSARIPTNIAGIIFFAQKAVLHPTAPLYDSREHTLKPAAVDALRRIFRLCDTNKDGVLDTHELNEFQQTCFKSPLQPQEVEGIKTILRSHDPSMLRPAPSPPQSSPRDSPPGTPPIEEGVTEDGFLYLHTEFIRRARVETTWVVLRQFGYAEDLKLTEGWLAPKFDVPQDCSVELSPQGYQFFTDIFQIFDKDQDGALRPEELDNLFNTSPGNPWVADDDEGVDGTITLQHWLAKWSMTTLLDHKKTLAYLAYLGYNAGPTTSALKITKPRRAERRKGKVTRNVFLCYVVGAAGSGKSSILNCFREVGGGGVGGNVTGKETAKGKGKGGLDEVGPYRPTEKVLSVVGAVELRGAEKYLVVSLLPLHKLTPELG
ncbi:ERMES complex Ca(2+)-binding regulatory GTPase gem1 [Ceratobasidium sp. UAMH 11750]|nr:ERMES complex Ca(2+)-binding regulatory GTPase gem1 [Ceratobasidium sp. UAMH 11750]